MTSSPVDERTTALPNTTTTTTTTATLIPRPALLALYLLAAVAATSRAALAATAPDQTISSELSSRGTSDCSAVLAAQQIPSPDQEPVSRTPECAARCAAASKCTHFSISETAPRHCHMWSIPVWAEFDSLYHTKDTRTRDNSPGTGGCQSLFAWATDPVDTPYTEQGNSDVTFAAGCEFSHEHHDPNRTQIHNSVSSRTECASLCIQDPQCVLFSFTDAPASCRILSLQASQTDSFRPRPAAPQAICGYISGRLRDVYRRHILETYAPRVYLAVGEHYYPSSVSFALDGMTRIYKDGHWNLRLDDAAIRPGQDVAADGGVPVYGFYRSDAGHEDLYLVYYFFYPFNAPKRVMRSLYGSHDADWEHITVHVRRGIPRSVAYAAHEHFTTVPWDSIDTVHSTHPVVYSAKGAHGSYPSPGIHNYKDIVITDLTDHCSQGAPWDTWHWVEAFDWENKVTIRGNRESPRVELPYWLRSGAHDFSFGDQNPRSGPVWRWGYVYKKEMKCGISRQCTKVQGPLGPNLKDPSEGPLVNLGHEFKPQVVFYEANNLAGSRVCSLVLSTSAQYDLKAKKRVCRNDEIRSASFSNIPRGTRVRVCDNRYCSTADDITDIYFKEFTVGLDVASFEEDIDGHSYSISRVKRQKWLDGKISRIEVFTNVTAKVNSRGYSLLVSNIHSEHQSPSCTAIETGETCMAKHYFFSCD